MPLLVGSFPHCPYHSHQDPAHLPRSDHQPGGGIRALAVLIINLPVRIFEEKRKMDMAVSKPLLIPGIHFHHAHNKFHIFYGMDGKRILVKIRKVEGQFRNVVGFLCVCHIPSALTEHIYRRLLPVKGRTDLTAGLQKAFVIPNASLIASGQHFGHEEAIFIIFNVNVFLSRNKIPAHNPSSYPCSFSPFASFTM